MIEKTDERLDMTTTKGNSSPIKYTRKEIDLIKSIYAKGASDDEFKLMIHLSKEYGLNILQKHIWLIKFGKAPALIFVGRDGFLDIAHRSGYFDGMETNIEMVEEPFSASYTETTWENNKPIKTPKVVTFDFQYVATCIIYRKDTKHPIKVTVYESEYSTGRDNWFTKRRTMIGKVAESQGLRKGFSVSGVYAPEEIDLSKPPVTPGYEVQPDFPKRSEINQKLNPDNCKTKDEYDLIYNEFIEKFGSHSLEMESGHKTETWKQLFSTHMKRVSRNPKPQGRWDERILKCDTIEGWHTLNEEYSSSTNLQCPENEQLLNDSKESIGITEN